MTKVDRLRKQISELQAQIHTLQDKCKHEELPIIDSGGDTGNYDISQDCYWETYECKKCRRLKRIYINPHNHNRREVWF